VTNNSAQSSKYSKPPKYIHQGDEQQSSVGGHNKAGEFEDRTDSCERMSEINDKLKQELNEVINKMEL